MNIPYITEALRLGNFRLKSESDVKAGLTVNVSSVKGGVKGTTESAAATTGEGLVVAYKLHRIDPKTYSKQDSGSVALELDKAIDFPQAGLSVRSHLTVIEAEPIDLCPEISSGPVIRRTPRARIWLQPGSSN